MFNSFRFYLKNTLFNCMNKIVYANNCLWFRESEIIMIENIFLNRSVFFSPNNHIALRIVYIRYVLLKLQLTYLGSQYNIHLQIRLAFSLHIYLIHILHQTNGNHLGLLVLRTVHHPSALFHYIRTSGHRGIKLAAFDVDPPRWMCNSFAGRTCLPIRRVLRTRSSREGFHTQTSEERAWDRGGRVAMGAGWELLALARSARRALQSLSRADGSTCYVNMFSRSCLLNEYR